MNILLAGSPRAYIMDPHGQPLRAELSPKPSVIGHHGTEVISRTPAWIGLPLDAPNSKPLKTVSESNAYLEGQADSVSRLITP